MSTTDGSDMADAHQCGGVFQEPRQKNRVGGVRQRDECSSDQPWSESYVRFLQSVCERSSLLRGNELETRLKAVESGVAQTKFLSSLFTSKPVSATLVRRPSRLFCAILTVSVLLFLVFTAVRINSDFSDKTDKYVSLRPLAIKDGPRNTDTTPFLQPYVNYFGVTRNGVETRWLKSWSKMDRLIVFMDPPVYINGFFFTADVDLSGVEVATSNDGATWRVMYRSECGFSEPTQLADGREVSAAISWYSKGRLWCYIGAFTALLFAVGCGCGLLVQLHRGVVVEAKRWFVLALSSSMVGFLLINVVTWRPTQCYWHPITVLSLLARYLFFVAGQYLAFALWVERGVVAGLASFGLLGLWAAVVWLFDGPHNPGSVAANYGLMGVVTLFVAFPLSAWLAQRRQRRAANELVLGDMQQYREAWRALVGAEGGRGQGEVAWVLGEIREVVGRLVPKEGGAAARHVHRAQPGAEGGRRREAMMAALRAKSRGVGRALGWLAWGGSAQGEERWGGVEKGGFGGVSVTVLPVDFGGCGEWREGTWTKEGGGGSGRRVEGKRCEWLRGMWEEEAAQGEQQRLAHTFPDGAGRGLPGTRDLQDPVRSLDQLYHQACSLDPVLRRAVRRWAVQSRGGLAAVNAEGWEAAHVEVASLGDGEEIKWARLKSPCRAIQKAIRSYQGDVSRIVDICRQAIVFGSLWDVLACLKAIAEDEEVRVLRVKNRLDPEYDDALSAGYRDVALNVVVVTEETVRLGVENHVCELQLLLTDFYRLKTEEGHRRYVEFRDMRAE